MSTFTLAYPEYDIAESLMATFAKKENYSVSIPLSRQQKFYDLILLNGESRKYLTIQVKSSRAYPGIKKGDIFDYYAWLNVFDISRNLSDYYFIYINYPEKTIRTNAKWKRNILVFRADEMKSILSKLRTKKDTPEKFYGFGFNQDSNDIYGQRGFLSEIKPNFKNNLFENKIGEIRNILK